MSMYVGILSDALRARDGVLSREALVEHVVDSRLQMLSARTGNSPSAYDLLAAEIAYDASLISLCDDLEVAAGAADFADPLAARGRIERVLAESHGIDLSALTRARGQI